MLKDDLGNRIKHNYEEVSKTRLTRRMPVVIRLDGCHFHTVTKGFKKPFDDVLIKAMDETMKYLCEHIQGCVLGYTQSDEITLVLVDYAKLESEAWFNYEVQKMCSVAASMATMAFNRAFVDAIGPFFENYIIADNITDEDARLAKAYSRVECEGATFDARCFNIPKEEVTNCVYWRQLDAVRNSILSLAQSLYSQKEMQGISCKVLQDKMLAEKNIEWNKLPTRKRFGSCCIKKDSGWQVDLDIPMFIGEGRSYIENLVSVGE